jgi:hypothetical protein
MRYIPWVVQVVGKRVGGLELILEFNLGFGLLIVKSGQPRGPDLLVDSLPHIECRLLLRFGTTSLWLGGMSHVCNQLVIIYTNKFYVMLFQCANVFF